MTEEFSQLMQQLNDMNIDMIETVGYAVYDQNKLAPTEPTKAHPEDSGFDVVATSCQPYDKNPEVLVYGTNIKVEIPKGYELQLRPRSSIRNYDLILINSPGTIDPPFRGEIMVCFRKIPRPDGTIRVYSVGDKIAQLVLAPVFPAKFIRVSEVSASSRGEKGFGSSGA